MKKSIFVTFYSVLIAICLIFVSLSGCNKTNNLIVETKAEPENPLTPDPEPEPLEGFVITSVSGSTNQGGTAVVSGNGFTTETDASLFFTDFEHGILGEGLVGDISWLRGAVKSVPGSYRYADNAPLTYLYPSFVGTRVSEYFSDSNGFNRFQARDLPNDKPYGNGYYLQIHDWLFACQRSGVPVCGQCG